MLCVFSFFVPIRNCSTMIHDFRCALANWRVIHLLGLSSLRGRFARSKLGQTWLAVSVFINICIIGVVWSYIWKLPMREYLPYLGIGHVVYLFASQTISDSTGILISNSRLYVNQKLPLSLSILAHLYKNIIIFLHNIPIVLFLLFLMPDTHFSFDFLFLGGFILTILFLLFISYALSILCVRYRDLIQIISIIMQSIFLITPVMWKTSLISEQYRNLIYINPFASILDIWRTPLLGGEVYPIAYISLLIWCLFSFVLGFIFQKIFSKNIIFWMQ
jgi:lipopolysaccharide transport system permease protein